MDILLENLIIIGYIYWIVYEIKDFKVNVDKEYNMDSNIEEKVGCLFVLGIIIAIAVFFKQTILAIIIVTLVLSWWVIKYINNFIKGIILNSAINNSPFNAELYNDRAYFNIKRRKYKKALRDYTKVIQLNSHNPAESLANKAYTYYLMGENHQSIKEYNNAIDYQPNCATWYYYRALAYIACKSEGAYKEALADLNTAYDLEFNNENKVKFNISSKNFLFLEEDIYYWQGWLYSKLNKPYCALEKFNKLPSFYIGDDLGSVKKECKEKLENIQQIETGINLEYWNNMNGWEFEGAVAKVFKQLGYNVTVTKGSGDGGVDIIIEKSNYRAIVQCKHYKYPVEPEPVRALWGVKDDFNADDVILVATNGVTQSGQEFIDKRPNFKLYTLDDIISLMRHNVAAIDNKFINEIRWYAKRPPQNDANTDIILFVTVDNSYAGTKLPIEYYVWKQDENNNFKSQKRTLTIQIPQNFKYGMKLKCKGEGNIKYQKKEIPELCISEFDDSLNFEERIKNNIGDLYLLLIEKDSESCELSEDFKSNNFDNINDEIEEEFKKFNWGAFLFPAIWMIGNGCEDIFGLCLIFGFILNLLYKNGIPETVGIIAYIALSIFLGIKGNKLSWKRKEYTDIEDFRSVQLLWLTISSVIIVIIIVLLILCHLK